MHTNRIAKISLTVFLLLLWCYPCLVVSGEPDGDRNSVVNQQVDKLIKLNHLEMEADKLFYAGVDSEDYNSKEIYLSDALTKYMLLLKLKPADAIIATQIAVIHDNLGHSSLAKEYFLKATNLDNLNPYTNFYFAEYYFAKKDYSNALKYYLISYNNGYKNYFPVTLKLATVYEKLGDIAKARKFYVIAQEQNPSQPGLRDKIKSLEKVYYSKSDYVRN